MSEDMGDMSVQCQLKSGLYVKAQPFPFPGKFGPLRWLLCKLGNHLPGRESDGWFCAACLKQTRVESKADIWLQQEIRSEVISNIEELCHEIRRIETGAPTNTLDSLKRTKNRLVALNRRIHAYRVAR